MNKAVKFIDTVERANIGETIRCAIAQVSTQVIPMVNEVAVSQ